MKVHLIARRDTKYLLVALLTGVILLFLAHIDDFSYAQNVRPTRATFASTRGTVRVYPNGGTPSVRPDEHRELISNGQIQDQLWVEGNLESWAHIVFWNQGQRIDPAVQVGGVRTPTRYRFPCWIEQTGSSVFAWGFEPSGSACNTITASVGNFSEPVARKANSQELANGDFAPQITITRSERLTLIHVYESEGGVAVDVLVGAVRITLFNGSFIDVNSGNRYIQLLEEGNIQPINLSEAVESPSVESFLDETNWSSDIPSFLEELKSALQNSSILTEDQQAILDTHNRLRAEVNVPPLRWSPELSAYAQEWANELSRTNSFNHSPGNSRSGAGENIAAGSSVRLMLSLWANEKDDYNDSTGICRSGRVCGHYTQMVWRNTTEIGCGIASHRTYGGVLVCNYSPPGNYVGQRPY